MAYKRFSIGLVNKSLISGKSQPLNPSFWQYLQQRSGDVGYALNYGWFQAGSLNSRLPSAFIAIKGFTNKKGAFRLDSVVKKQEVGFYLPQGVGKPYSLTQGYRTRTDGVSLVLSNPANYVMWNPFWYCKLKEYITEPYNGNSAKYMQDSKWQNNKNMENFEPARVELGIVPSGEVATLPAGGVEVLAQGAIKADLGTFADYNINLKQDSVGGACVIAPDVSSGWYLAPLDSSKNIHFYAKADGNLTLHNPRPYDVCFSYYTHIGDGFQKPLFYYRLRLKAYASKVLDLADTHTQALINQNAHILGEFIANP